jgi:Protein of unknown function (DUF2934)
MAKPKAPKKNGVDQTATPVETAVTPSAVEATASQPMSGESKKLARKPSIVRSEPRANIVPINLEEEIRRLAYLLSERRGFEPGHETEDWLMAEHEIMLRYHQQSA